MNPVRALSELRARGLLVTPDGIEGPVRDRRAMEHWFARNRQGIALALALEGHAAVRLVQQVFPKARLVDALLPSTPRP